MKKKIDKEEKQEKIKRILKIVGCSVGLLLCGGAFIGLLFVGVRGCSATPRSPQKNAMDNSLSITLESDKAVPQYVNINDSIKRNNDSVLFIDYLENMPHDYIDIVDNYESINEDFDLGGRLIYSLNNNIINFDSINYGHYYVDTREYINIYINNTYRLSYSRLHRTGSDWEPYADDSGANFLHEGDYLLFNQSLTDYINSLNNNDVNFTRAKNELLKVLDFVSSFGYNYDIYFNNVINPFGPFGSNFDYFINLSLTGPKVLFKGLFTDSNGQLYKQIDLSYLSAQGMRYGTTTDYQIYSQDGSHYMVMIYYTIDNKQVIVNAQDYGIATSGKEEGNGVMLKSNHFISNVFQSIKVLYIDFTGDYIGNTYNRLQALTSLNNNVNGSATYTDGGNIGGSNPFILIGNAFTSLMPFLSITIIPGLTIGTLLLIPLVGMIVLFVVFLFKR